MATETPKAKTIGLAQADPRLSTSVSITRGTKTHRGRKSKDGSLINDSMEFQVTVTLHEAAPGQMSQSEIYDQAVKFLDDAYFDQLGTSGACMTALLEAQE